MKDQFLWVEKYRPQSITDCVLPESIKSHFKQFLESKDFPNLLLTGTQGVGKTSIAKALCNELDLNFYFLNASEAGNIDTLRTTLRTFASTVSFGGEFKVIILDEADHLTNAAQHALRSFMEEFSINCRFILTANFANRIIDPLQSRCTVIDFSIKKSESLSVAKAFAARIKFIIDVENIEYDEKVMRTVLPKFIVKHFPDYRRIINEIQKYSMSGKLDEGILNLSGESDFDELFKFLKAKDFKNLRKWVTENVALNEPEAFSKRLYKQMDTYLQGQYKPVFILLLRDYLRDSAVGIDKEINMIAFLLDVANDIEFGE